MAVISPSAPPARFAFDLDAFVAAAVAAVPEPQPLPAESRRPISFDLDGIGVTHRCWLCPPDALVITSFVAITQWLGPKRLGKRLSINPHRLTPAEVDAIYEWATASPQPNRIPQRIATILS